MLSWICSKLLHLAGWKVVQPFPSQSHYVLIAYPHTSNWDFIIGMLAMGATDYRFHWVAKHSLFRGPMGTVMRALGGIPVNRATTQGFIGDLAQRFADNPRFIIAITPEGTRSYVPHLRTGFYHLAQQAGVPIALGYLDFPTKTIGIGPVFAPCGNIEQDMATIRLFYADKRGKFSNKEGCIKTRSNRAGTREKTE